MSHHSEANKPETDVGTSFNSNSEHISPDATKLQGSTAYYMSSLSALLNENSTSKFLLKLYHDTYLSLPISRCYDAHKSGYSTNNWNSTLSGATSALQNFKDVSNLNLCFVNWSGVDLLITNSTYLRKNVNKIFPEDAFKPDHQLSTLASGRVSIQSVTKLVQNYNNKFNYDEQDFFKLSGLVDTLGNATSSFREENTNFQFAKSIYLTLSLILALIAIFTNILILLIIFINTKDKIQHYFSCWCFNWLRFLSNLRSNGIGGRSGGCSSRSGGMHSSGGSSIGGTSNGNCITSHHYLLLFQLTLTGLILASHIMLDDIRIHQTDKQIEIIYDYELSLQARLNLHRRAYLSEDNDAASSLVGIHNQLMRQYREYGSIQGIPPHWLRPAVSALTIFLPPSPFEAAFKLDHLEDWRQCEDKIELDMIKRWHRESRSSESRFDKRKVVSNQKLRSRDESTFRDFASTKGNDIAILLDLESISRPQSDYIGKIMLETSQLPPGLSLGTEGPTITPNGLRHLVGSLHVMEIDQNCFDPTLRSENNENRYHESSNSMFMCFVATVHIWIVVALAYDRYCAIAYPLEYLRSINSTRAKAFLLLLWFIAILVNFILPLTIEYVNQVAIDRPRQLKLDLEHKNTSESVCLSNFWSDPHTCSSLYSDSIARFGMTTVGLLGYSTSNASIESRANSMNTSIAEEINRKQSTLSMELAFSALGFLFIIFIPLLIITICNVNIYFIVKGHQRRLSASSGSHGTGSIYQFKNGLKRSYADLFNHGNNSCNANMVDKSDSCSIASSMLGKLIWASAQVGLISATMNQQQTIEQNASINDSCYCSYTSENHVQNSQSNHMGSNDLISFSPNKKSHFPNDEQRFHRERSSSFKIQSHTSRRGSLISQANSTSAAKSSAKINGNQDSSLNGAKSLQSDKICSESESNPATPTIDHPIQANQFRLKRKLSDRYRPTSLAPSRRSSFALSESCGRKQTCASHHKHAGNCKCSHEFHNTRSVQKHQLERQDTDGIMHQIKLAGLSFAGIAVNDMVHHQPTASETSHYSASNRLRRKSLNRSSSCSLYNLGSQALNSFEPTGSMACPNNSNNNYCNANKGLSHGRLSANVHRESSVNPNVGSNHLRGNNHSSNNSSQFSVNKCSNLIEVPSKDPNQWPRKSYVSLTGNNSCGRSINTRVLDSDSENQFAMFNHQHREHSSRGNHSSIGTKSGIFNATIWAVLILFIASIPCYLIPFSIRLSSLLHRVIETEDDSKLESTIQLISELGRAIGSKDFASTPMNEPKQKFFVYWIETSFVWLSSLCRLMFLLSIPLHGWLYGIRSRSLKTTFKMVLKRYVSKKQAAIEISHRRRSNSSLRSRDSSVYCFHQPNQSNSCNCSQFQQQAHTYNWTSPTRQSYILNNITPTLMTAPPQEENRCKVFRRCASFNLDPVSPKVTTIDEYQLQAQISGTGQLESGLILEKASCDQLNSGCDLGSEQVAHNEVLDIKSTARQCNSIRFVIGQHAQISGETNEQGSPTLDETPPSPSKGLLNSIGTFLMPHSNNHPSTNASLSSSRYSSQNSSLNSSLADSNRSLLSASIQSSQSAAFMLLGEQASSNLDKPKLSGVLKKSSAQNLAQSTTAAIESTTVHSGNMSSINSSSPSGSRCISSQATSKIALDKIGRAKSLDHHKRKLDPSYDYSPIIDEGSNTEALNSCSNAGNSRRVFASKRFATNSIDTTVPLIARTQTGYATAKGHQISSQAGSSIVAQPPAHDKSSDAQTDVDADFVMSKDQVTKLSEHKRLRKLSSDITFLLTSVDQSETTQLDFNIADNGEKTTLDKGNSSSSMMVIKSDSLDSGDSINHADEMSEMLPNDISKNISEPNLAKEDNISQVTSATDNSSLHRVNDSKIKQMRDAISKYLSSMAKVKVNTTKFVRSDGYKATKSATRSHSNSICNRIHSKPDYDYSPVTNPLFRKYSDSTASTCSTKTSSDHGIACPVDSANARYNSLDSCSRSCKHRTKCRRDKSTPSMRKSASHLGDQLQVSPQKNANHEVKRRNSLGVRCAAAQSFPSALHANANETNHECQNDSCQCHQQDHHHLKPPNCLKLIFDQESHQPPSYTGALALSPIKECSSNHSCASSQSSLNNTYSNTQTNVTHNADSQLVPEVIGNQ